MTSATERLAPIEDQTSAGLSTVSLWFYPARLQTLPLSESAAAEIDASSTDHRGHFVGFLHGGYSTDGTAGALELTLQGERETEYYAEPPTLHPVADTNITRWVARLYRDGPAGTETLPRSDELTCWATVRPNTATDPDTLQAVQRYDFAVNLSPGAADTELVRLADGDIAGARDIEVATDLSAYGGTRHSVLVSAELPASPTQNRATIDFLLRQNIEPVSTGVEKVRDPPPLVRRLAPADDDKGGPLVCPAVSADYFPYSPGSPYAIFADRQGDDFWIAAAPNPTVAGAAGDPYGRTTAAVWLPGGPTVGTEANRYDVSYPSPAPLDRNIAQQVTVSQTIQAQQPAGTTVATAVQQIVTSPYDPAPLAAPAGETVIHVPASSNAPPAQDVSALVGNPDGRPIQIFLLPAGNPDGARTAAQNSIGGRYEVSGTEVAAARRIVGGVLQTSPHGETIYVLAETGESITGGRGPDRGPASQAVVRLHYYWAGPLGISASAFQSAAAPGIVHLERDQTSATGEITGSISNPDSRPLTAVNGDGQTSWAEPNGAADLRLAARADDPQHWELTVTRPAGPWAFGEAQTFLVQAHVSTADAWAPSTTILFFRVTVDPPAPGL